MTMIIEKNVLEGGSLNDNTAPIIKSRDCICIPGSMKGRRAFIPFYEETLRMHTLLLGGTGSGKTNAMKHLISNVFDILDADDAAIIFDSKLDFTAFQRKCDVVISSRNNTEAAKAKWNIFADITADGWGKEAISSNADEISDVIFSEAIRKSSQPFFPEAARGIFAAVLKGMTYLGINDESHRRKYLNNRALSSYLTGLNAQRLCEFLGQMPELCGALKFTGNGASDQALGVFAELQAVTSRIFTGPFNNDGDFSVRSLVRNRGGRVFFVEYDPANGSSLQNVYRLLVDLFLKEALYPKKNPKGNVFVFCDELKMLPHLKHLEDVLNFGRSLGVCVFAGIQSIQQLYEVYGEFGGNNIASAFQSSLCFRTNDEASRKYIREKGGRNVTSMQYIRPDGRTEIKQSEGYAIEDWDINSLNCGEAIVSLVGEKPFRIQIDKWR